MAGRPKKKHEPQNPLIKKPSEHVDSAEFAVQHAMRALNDGFDVPFREHVQIPVEQPKAQTSSIPHGEFKEMTEGLRPRSRAADTREMQLRSKEEQIAYYKQNINRTQGDRLHVPQHLIPEGYSFLWARAQVRNYPDSPNLRSLQSKGWRFARADEMPGLAFYDHFHGVRDDAEHVYNSGLVGMLRYKELNHYELQERRKLSINQARPLTDRFRSVMKDLHPFASGGSDTMYANNSRINYSSLRDMEVNVARSMPAGQDFRMAGY